MGFEPLPQPALTLDELPPWIFSHIAITKLYSKTSLRNSLKGNYESSAIINHLKGGLFWVLLLVPALSVFCAFPDLCLLNISKAPLWQKQSHPPSEGNKVTATWRHWHRSRRHNTDQTQPITLKTYRLLCPILDPELHHPVWTNTCSLSPSPSEWLYYPSYSPFKMYCMGL